MPIKLIFCGCIHGDEYIGKYIFERYPLGRNEDFVWRSIIANPEAMYLNQRFIDADLNRSFPGKLDGNYEERRAYQLTKILSEFDLIIDLHQTYSDMDDTIVVHNLTPELYEICQYFNIKHIVTLDKENSYYDGILLGHVKNSIAVEYGGIYNFQDSCQRVEKDIQNILDKRVVNINHSYYRILGTVETKFESKLNLKNYQKLTEEEREILGIYEDNVYPFFIGSEGYQGIYCILLQKKDICEI
jgi:succinylglutamate desuccinylase